MTTPPATARLALDMTDDQELLVATTRSFLERESPLPRVRELARDPAGFDAKTFEQGAELGWFSLLVAEEHGGGSVSGDGVHDLALLAGELGRLLFPGPVLEANLVAFALSHWGTEEQRAAHLGSIITGDTIAVCAAGRGVSAVRTADGFRLDGTDALVQDAHVADVLLVVADDDDDGRLLLVPLPTAGIVVEPLESLDLTRRYATVGFDGALVPASAALEAGAGGGARLAELAVVLQCAETVGAIDEIFWRTREYALDRVAFGRPIGSFQAVKHRLAEMLGWIESSKAVTLAAAKAVHRGDAAELASAAKAYVGAQAPLVTRGCLQVHGGMGYTWEHDVHLYLRRVESSRALHGSPEEHLDRLAGLLGMEAR